MLLDKAFLLFIFFHYTYCASCLSSDSFVTGSGNGELGCDYYINDIAVSWTITLPVERGEYIVLLFDNFNLFSGDFLTIYDGNHFLFFIFLFVTNRTLKVLMKLVIFLVNSLEM